MSGTQVDPLDRAIDTLSGLVTTDERDAVQDLRARLKTRRLRVLIAGEAKRGKSTLVNRLLGREVLPTGVVPVTAIAATVRQRRENDDEHVAVRFRDGRRARYELDALSDFVTERENPNNVKMIDSVEVLLGPGPLDAFDVELVDTPGTGSVFEHNTTTARDALDGLDAAIFVVTADPPISAAERDLLRDVVALSVHTVVLLNKSDQLAPDDLAQAIEFTQTVCGHVSDSPIQIFAGSARAGMTDPGYAQFASEFDHYLASSARADADLALRGHLVRLASSVLDGALLTERSLQMADTQSQGRVQLFREKINVVQARQDELDDRCWAIERGLRRSLDQSATQLLGEVTARCNEQVTEALDTSLSGLVADEMEERGRAVAVELIETNVDRWRAEQTRSLEAGLNQVWERVIGEQDKQLVELRDAARELLDLSLSTASEERRLRPSRGFWYAFDRPVAVEPPLAGTVRRLAPGKTRRARGRLLAELPELVDRQVGRARADLQERLQESTRSMLGELRRSHQRLLLRLQSALTDADAIREADGETRGTQLDRLTGRIAQLHGVVADLNGA